MEDFFPKKFSAMKSQQFKYFRMADKNIFLNGLQTLPI